MARYELPDTRNVQDHFKGMAEADVKAELLRRDIGLSVFMPNIERDINFSSVVRTCNAMGVTRVYYWGPSRRWDRRGAVGTYHYIDVEYLQDLDQVIELFSQHRCVALENNIDESVCIADFTWPVSSNRYLLVLGEESTGVPDKILTLCDDFVYIPQLGSVRSMNVAVAAGMAIYDYTRHRF